MSERSECLKSVMHQVELRKLESYSVSVTVARLCFKLLLENSNYSPFHHTLAGLTFFVFH